VIVDMAGETGGNCELTEPGKTVVVHDVTIASPLNLPATMPEHASELYSKNIAALLELMLVEGKLAPDFTDQVLADSCVTRVVPQAPSPAQTEQIAEADAAPAANKEQS
jgi:H+-translocating NAD(P) transhydrogenase subunit alpha